MESLTQLNLVAPARLLQAVIPGMRTRKRGRILVIGSGAGTFPMPGPVRWASTQLPGSRVAWVAPSLA